MLKLNRLTTKFVDTVTRNGRYADGGGLYLEVGANGKAKSFVFIFNRARFGGKNAGNIGVGSARTTSLAQARLSAQTYREQIRNGVDPLTQRQSERRQQWLADAKNVTFLALANEFIDVKSTGPEAWKPNTRTGALSALHRYLKPLHDYPVSEINASMIHTILRPIWQTTPAMARAVRLHAECIFKWAIAKGAFPADKANPASMKGPLGILLQDRQPPVTHRPSLHFRQVPVLMAKLRSFEPRTHYTVGEAARAVGKARLTLHLALEDGKLVGRKPERPVFPGSWQSWEIKPADLFKVWPKKVEVVPGLRSVSIYLIQFSILTAVRPGEARYMRWSEYDEDSGVWTLPWERTKMGRKIRRDHIVFLNDPDIEILDTLRKQQQRDDIKTEFVFGNYLTANNTSARIGQPPNGLAVLNLLHHYVGDDTKDASMHGFRTSFGSWATEEGYPDKDIARAHGHVAGLGATQVSRIYTRDAVRRDSLYRMMVHWGKYCISGDQPAEIIPLRRKKAT
jgi:integrase